MKLRTRSRFLFNRSKKAKARRSRDPSRIDPSRTFALRKAFANKVKLAFAKLKGAVFKLVAVEDAFGLKDRQAVKNVAAEETSFDVPVSVPISPPPPFRLIEVPDVRQRDHFSCGAASANSVGLHFGVGPKTLEAWKKLLGTDVEESTHPQAIVKAFADLGLSVSARSGMTVEDLARLTSRGAPVICPVQDYG